MARPATGASTRPATGLLGIGGALSLIGSVLPWSELSSGGERRVFSGVTVGDGRICLLIGLALIVCAALVATGRAAPGPDRATGPVPAAAAALAAVVLLLTGADYAAGPAPLASFRGLSAGLVHLEPRAGLAVTLLGGLLAEIGATALLWRGRPPRPSPRPDPQPARPAASGVERRPTG